MDADGNGYLDQRELLTGLFRLYCSNFDEKTEFVFEIYDFDGQIAFMRSTYAIYEIDKTLLPNNPVSNQDYQ